MAPRFEESRVAPPQHSDSQERVLRCRHRVRIPRHAWPPRDKRGNEERPTLRAQCQHCGAQLLVEDPVPRNLDVVLYGPKDAVGGRVLEEPEGRVLDEAEVPPEPTGGTVTDEHELNPRGRRRA